MANWIYDGTAGAYGTLTGNQFPKADLVPLPASAPAADYVVAFDWNTVAQALTDIRSDWLGAKFYGFLEQASDPAPTGLGGVGQPGYLWPKNDHTLHYHVNGADSALGGGGGVSSVSNADGTLTISPTTGAVVASIALGHANSWSATQTFTAAATILPAAFAKGLVFGTGLDSSSLLLSGETLLSGDVGLRIWTGDNSTFRSIELNRLEARSVVGTIFGASTWSAVFDNNSNNGRMSVASGGEISFSSTTDALGGSRDVAMTRGAAAQLNLTGSFKPSVHYLSSGSAPSTAAGTGAGTGPTISVTGNDTAGVLNVTTGTAPAGSNATIVTLTFATAFAATPLSVLIFAANANAASALGGATEVYPDQATLAAASWVLKTGTTALTASTAYKWFYIVLG